LAASLVFQPQVLAQPQVFSRLVPRRALLVAPWVRQLQVSGWPGLRGGLQPEWGLRWVPVRWGLGRWVLERWVLERFPWRPEVWARVRPARRGRELEVAGQQV